MNVCKICDNQRHINWRKNNPERVRELSKLQRERNPEKMRGFVSKYAKSHPEGARKRCKKWAKHNKEKISAHGAVAYAIMIGSIKRQSCFCGKYAHAHHEDYSKKLEVVWLCPIHHKARHMELLKTPLTKVLVRENKKNMI